MSSAEGYALQWRDEAKADMRGLPGLSRSERNRIILNLHEQLSRVTDDYLAEPSNRPDSASPEFEWTLILAADNGGETPPPDGAPVKTMSCA